MKLSEEELEIFGLALLLKTTVATLVAEMSYEELQGWMAYFKARPVEWRDDHRTSMLLSVQGVKDATNLFPSLKSMHNQENVIVNSLKQSQMFCFMGKARGGATLPGVKNGD